MARPQVRRTPRRPAFRPFLTRLEDRDVPATFVVNTTADTGAGSLRQAITDANAAAGADAIVFAAGLSGQTITATSAALPTITDPVTITGLGPALLTVSGNNAFRVFDVATGGVTITGLTITKGLSPAGGDGGGVRQVGGSLTLDTVVLTANKADVNGGGVAVSGAGAVLTVTNSTISANANTNGDGGGVFVGTGATAAITGTVITGNQGSINQDGAGVRVSTSATVTLTDSTVSGNTGAGTAYFGGGIRSDGTLTVLRTTLSGNTSGGRGGAISITGGTATITNSTIVGNTAQASNGGGGIQISAGTATITNCTITDNNDTSAAATNAGGVSLSGGTATLANTVVANNSTANGVAKDVRGTFAAGSNNNFLTFADANTNLANGVNGNVVGADAKLGPLQFNGGPTQTRVPLAGSPLINAGSNAAIPAGTTLDQRGLVRTIGTVDIGATEVQPASPLAVGGSLDGRATVFAPNAAGQYGTPTTLPAVFGSATVNARTAVADVNGDGFPDTILVTGPGTPIRFAVISGKDNTTVLVPATAPFAGSEDFTGGGFVAAGDFERTGRADIVITPDQGGGPRVSIFGLPAGGLTLRANFFGIDDPNFRGGARAAAGDVNRDGTPDLMVAAGFGGGPRIAVFNGTTLFTTPTRLVNDFFAFPGPDATTLRNGTFVAAGDVNG
ncbi:MAG: Calx-beta domain protein, partial [Gemmataceae bacterium]|nr:Calx-beta domain protein [Gemmataceae bacterium]